MEKLCPILGRTTTVDETAFSRDTWSVVRCRETGFVFLANPPDYSKLETDFAWEKTWEQESRRREVDEPVVSRISSCAKKAKTTAFPTRNKIATIAFGIIRTMHGVDPVRVVDIGCGGGGLMVEIHKRCADIGRNVMLHGIEVSRQLAADSQERVAEWDGRIICANAIDGTSELEADSIHIALMSSFLEHECQPLCLLQRLHPVLAADGAIVLKVPNFACWNRLLRGRKWCGFRYPDHVNYFTPRTLRRLAREAGFTVSRQHIWDRFPLSDNMYAVLTKA
jgi:SAM-dependent methyltransferase